MPLATRRIAAFAALGLTLIAAACSDDDDAEPAEDAASEETTTNEPAADEEMAAAEAAAAEEVVTDDAPSGDVATTFAERLYETTPVGVTEADATCLASAVISVVGEEAVETAGYDSNTVYGGTSPEQDAQIASTAFGCTSAEADSALAAEVGGEWPDAWNPA
jgi:hypothetical protein